MGSIRLKMKRCSLTILMLASGSAFAANPASSNYAIPWDVLDGGGGGSNSLNYAMAGSVAQGGVGQSSSPGYVMLAGFHSLPDSDGDGIKDFMDNCTLVANPNQIDADGNGVGNRCDGDLGGTLNFVDPADITLFAQLFLSGDPRLDINENGTVDPPDITLFTGLVNKSIGPSCCGPN